MPSATSRRTRPAATSRARSHELTEVVHAHQTHPVDRFFSTLLDERGARLRGVALAEQGAALRARLAERRADLATRAGGRDCAARPVDPRPATRPRLTTD